MEDGTLAVFGSDHSSVYIFDVRTGAELQKIQLDVSSWILEIAVSNCFSYQDVAANSILRIQTGTFNGKSFIIAATAEQGSGDAKVFMLKRASAVVAEQRRDSTHGLVWIFLAFVFGCVAFIALDVGKMDRSRTIMMVW